MKRSRIVRLASRLLPVAALLVTAVASAAEIAEAPPDPERARTLFKEGRALATVGKYSEACAKFEESLRFDVGIGTEFNLADCWERVGRTASAYTLFARVTESAARSGQVDRAALAEGRARALEPRLARLVIRVDSPSPALEVLRNGKSIEGQVGRPIAVDPGVQEIEARAPGKRSWLGRLDVSGAPGTVSVIVPKLQDREEEGRKDKDDREEKSPVVPSDETRASVSPKQVPEVRPESIASTRGPATLVASGFAPEGGGDPTLRRAAFVFGTVGVAALVAGSWMLLEYRSSNEAAGDICPTSLNCTARQIEEHARLLDEARSARTWAYVGLGAGGAALIGATVAYLRSRSHGDSPGDSGRDAKGPASGDSDVALAPVVGPGTLGAAVGGRW